MIRLPALVAALLALWLALPARAETAAAPAAGRIDALVAPVALYPDALLMPLLMAATYPDEVAEAANWLAEAHNARLKGDALVAALEPRPWAPSVKALIPFPATLELMAARPGWMKPLGEAFVAAPATVMAEIQKLRRQAVTRHMLASSARLRLADDGGVIAIVSPDPAVIYVPVYNPALVFDPWPDADHPPVFIEPPPGFEVAGRDIETGIGFSVGFGAVAPLWGWAKPDWRGGTVAVDVAAYNRINRYGPHVASATWHFEPHPTGYFHIAQDQVTPPAPARHGDKRVTAKAKPSRHAHAARTDHRARHGRVAKAADRRKTAHAKGAARRGKIRVATDSHHARRRR